MTERDAMQEEMSHVKSVLRLFNYGLYVAASTGPDGPRAATLSWVTQISFEPRLIAIAVRKGTGIHLAIAASRRFALHLVGKEQADFAKAFFKAGPAAGGMQAIAGYNFTLSERGVPVFDDAPAWLECELIEDTCPGGGLADHALLVARVNGSGYRTPIASALALCDTAWHYGG
jgi:flavin reductase (DIM6/NTAB) family NADH-FMN oxidoreductase RutF